jgi:hypothetical protein
MLNKRAGDMKKLTILSIWLMAGSIAFAQSTALSFLSRLPKFPTNPYGMTAEQRQEYLDKIDELARELDDIIAPKLEAADSNAESSEAAAKNQMMKQTGLSAAEIAKLTSRNLSEAERKALLDKAMKKKSNVSMTETESLKNMSDEGKKAWSEGYAAEKAADMQGDKETLKKEEAVKSGNYKLASKKSELTNRIMAANKKYADQMNELELKDIKESAELAKAVEPYKKGLFGIGDSKSEEAVSSIRKLEKECTLKLTRIHYQILSEHLEKIKSLLPSVRELEEVNAKLNKTATGKTLSSSGLSELQAAAGFIKEMSNVFKYVKNSI